jgi:hypothetical protein
MNPAIRMMKNWTLKMAKLWDERVRVGGYMDDFLTNRPQINPLHQIRDTGKKTGR